jgi:hypothetical protein
MKVLRSALFISVMAAQVCAAEQFGDFIFDKPADWQSQQVGDEMRLTAPVPNSTSVVTVILLASQPVQGDFGGAFNRAVESKAQSYGRIVNSASERPIRLNSSTTALGRVFIVADSSGSNVYVFFLGIQAGSRLEMIAGETRDSQAFSKFTPALAAFAGSLRFTTRGATPSREMQIGSVSTRDVNVDSAGGLSGWFVGGENSSSFNPNTGYWSSGASYSYYRFFPDGRVFWGWTLPQGGTMDAFDRAPDPSKVGNYGRYTISGNRIRMVWAYKARPPENWPFSRDQDSITMAGTTYYRIAPCDNVRLTGTWGTSSFAATGRGNGVSGSRTITFTPDGQFRSNAFTGSVNAGPVAAGTTSRSSSGSGNYQVVGNTLELTYADGKREQHSFYRYPHEESKLIVIDGAMYLLR